MRAEIYVDSSFTFFELIKKERSNFISLFLPFFKCLLPPFFQINPCSLRINKFTLDLQTSTWRLRSLDGSWALKGMLISWTAKFKIGIKESGSVMLYCYKPSISFLYFITWISVISMTFLSFRWRNIALSWSNMEITFFLLSPEHNQFLFMRAKGITQMKATAKYKSNKLGIIYNCANFRVQEAPELPLYLYISALQGCTSAGHSTLV